MKPGQLRGLRLLAGSLAVLLFVWALFDPLFRDEEGLLTAAFTLPAALSVATLILGTALGRSWQRTGLWLALAVAGQAAALQLIVAGPFIRYQHFRVPLPDTTAVHVVALCLLALQTGAVAFGLSRVWRKIFEWSSRCYAPWQLIAIALIFLLTSATLSRQVSAYAGELLFATFLQSVNLANIILVGASLPAVALDSLGGRLSRLFGPAAAEPGGAAAVDRFHLVAAVWVVVVAALLAFFAYQRHPHLPDEVVYLYHARYLADGMLAMPAPPVQPAFDIDLMFYQESRWFSPVPPGWPAVLALGVLVGLPWLVNPLLGGINVLLAYTLLRELYSRGTARLATLLLATSPWLLFMSMNLMTHNLTLTCGLAAAVCVIRVRHTGRVRWAWLGGFAIGLAALTRPLEGLIIAGLLGLWSLAVPGRRFRFAPTAALALGSALVGGLTLPYNRYLVGAATRFPLMVYADERYGVGSNALGFGPDRGLGWTGLDPFPGHGPLDVLVNANLNTFSVNVELLGWSTGSILIIALFLFSRSLRKSDYMMLAAVAAVVGMHTFYWFSGGPDFGARYWYLIIVPCVALAARGIQFLAGQSTNRQEPPDERRRAGVLVGALALCLASLVTFVPWRAIDKYHHYRSMRPDIRQLADEYDFGSSLVLIRGRQHPDLGSAAIYNPLDLRAEAPIYAWDRSPAIRSRLLEVYSDRPIWVVDGPSVTGSGFEVIAGPIGLRQRHDLPPVWEDVR